VSGFTVDPQDSTIIDAQVIGLSGGDGGWSREDEGKWMDDSTLLLTQAEYYDDFE